MKNMKSMKILQKRIMKSEFRKKKFTTEDTGSTEENEVYGKGDVERAPE